MRFYILKDREVTFTNDVVAWAEFYENIENRRVERTRVGDVEILTDFVGHAVR